MSDVIETSRLGRTGRWLAPVRRLFVTAPLGTRRTIFMASLHIVLIWTMAIGLVWQNYHQSVESWKRSAEAISLTVAAYAGQSQRAAELVLRTMAEWVRDENIETAAQFDEVMARRRFYDTMRDSLLGLPQAESAGIASRTGQVLNSTIAWPPPALNVAQREAFRTMMEAEDGRVHATAPTPGINRGPSRFYLSRQIRTKSGELVGVMAIGLNTDYFATFFRSLSLGPGSRVSLFRSDGTLLATSLRDQALLGRRFEDSASYRLFASGQSGRATISEGPFRYDAGETTPSKIIVTHAIDGFPTFVSVAIGESAFLGPWRERTFLIVAIATLLTGLTVLASLRILRLVARAEESRHTEAKRQILEAIVDTPSALTAITDRAGRVLHCNARFREVMERVGDPSEVLFNPSLVGREKLLAFAADVGGATRTEVDLQLEHADHETQRLHFSLARQSLPDTGACMVLVGHDETQRFRLQQAIAVSTKLVTLGEITTSIAHEVSQPLNVIRMAAQNALLEGESDPEIKADEEEAFPLMADGEFRKFALEKFHGIIRQVDRAAIVLSRMRIFSRKGDAEELFDVREAVRTAVTLTLPVLKAGEIAVAQDLGECALWVKGSRAPFEQAVIYLLRNAREALVNGAEGSPKSIAITARREAGGRIEVIVRDNGPGVPEALAERIFEPFFSTKPNEKHLGLGLSLVYGAIRDMDGDVRLLAVAQGATLKISLPEAQAPAPTEQSAL